MNSRTAIIPLLVVLLRRRRAGETEREWGTPIVMDEAVKARVDALWGELGI